MRLGQLARKYDVPLQEIISYLNEIEPKHDVLHPNSRLDEQTTALVVQHFEPLTEVSQEAVNESDKETTEEASSNPIEPEVVNTEETIEAPQREVDLSPAETEGSDLPKKDEEAIETDRLLELLESEETPVDLSKITLIKAPRKELDGLKVVGKIDLPKPKSKAEEDTKEEEQESKSDKNSRPQRQSISEEEREKRRLRAKKKKAEYEARQERRKREKEKKEKKAVREAHYRQKLHQSKSNRQKPKTKAEKQTDSIEGVDQRPQPKTVLGKFWRWLNT